MKVTVRSRRRKIRQRRCDVVPIKRSRNRTYGVKGKRFEFDEL
jgi:hypothetical protein